MLWVIIYWEGLANRQLDEISMALTIAVILVVLGLYGLKHRGAINFATRGWGAEIIEANRKFLLRASLLLLFIGIASIILYPYIIFWAIGGFLVYDIIKFLPSIPGKTKKFAKDVLNGLK